MSQCRLCRSRLLVGSIPIRGEPALPKGFTQLFFLFWSLNPLISRLKHTVIERIGILMTAGLENHVFFLRIEIRTPGRISLQWR